MAKRTRCMTNQHNLGLSVIMYSDDYNQTYPPRPNDNIADRAIRWPTYLFPDYQTVAVLVCPSELGNNPSTLGVNNGVTNLPDRAPRTYFINGFNDGYTAKYGLWPTNSVPLPSLRENDIPDPSGTCMFGEKLYSDGDFFMDYFDIDDGLKLDQNKHSRSTLNTNLGGSMYVFADGSSRFLRVNASLSPLVLWCTTPLYRSGTAPP
jgi:hypothetical protein